METIDYVYITTIYILGHAAHRMMFLRSGRAPGDYNYGTLILALIMTMFLITFIYTAYKTDWEIIPIVLSIISSLITAILWQKGFSRDKSKKSSWDIYVDQTKSKKKSRKK